MSVEQKKEDIKEEKHDLIDLNVALMLAENSSLKTLIAEKDALNADLTKKLQQATDIIEEDTKSRLIIDIRDKTVVPDKYLKGKSVEELTKMKEVLDNAAIPAFRSGAPVYDKKDDPGTKLGKVFDDFASKTWRKS
jgi:hypothetical protein